MCRSWCIPTSLRAQGCEWDSNRRGGITQLFNATTNFADPLPLFPSLQAIRKKIESELSRKRPASKRTQQRSGPGGNAPRPKQGTVSALRPLPALTVPHSISVADASQLCAAKRTDCVLVVDEEEHLCGIFTAKDLAFRVSLIFCSRSSLGVCN